MPGLSILCVMTGSVRKKGYAGNDNTQHNKGGASWQVQSILCLITGSVRKTKREGYAGSDNALSIIKGGGLRLSKKDRLNRGHFITRCDK